MAASAPAPALGEGRPEHERGTALSPTRTPRPTFQVTRRLVGVSRWPLILLTAAYAISVSDQYLLPAVFPYLKRDFGLSDAALGLLGSSYLVVVTLGTIPFGALADRSNRTRVVAWAGAVWGVAMLWTGLAGSYLSLFLARMVLGGASPAVVPTSQSLLADYYPVHQRAKVLGVYQIGQLIGFFLIPLGAAMATAWGWQSAFYFFAAPGFVIAMLAWRLREPVRGEQDRRHQNLGKAAEPDGVVNVMSAREAYGQILRVPTFTVAMLSSALGSIFFGGIGVWTVTFLLRYHHLSVPAASVATSLFALGGLVGALGSGYVADYLNYAGHRSARVVVAGVARLAAFPLLYLAFSVHSTPVMLVMFTLGSVAIIAAIPPLNAVRLDVLQPRLRGRGTALDTVLQSLCSAASPLVFGILSDWFGLRAAFLTLIPLLALSGAMLLLFAVRTYGADEARVLEAIAAEPGLAPVDENTLASAAMAASALEPTGAAAAVAVAKVESRDGDDAEGFEVDAEEIHDSATADILVAENVTFSYGTVRVLFDTELRIGRGGCHALIGRNGVGKSTLLNVLAGLLEPQEGQIWFNGRAITGVPPDQRARLGLTLMGGGRATFPSLSLRENLWMGSYPFSTDRRLVEDRMEEILEVFPALRSHMAQPAGTLSGGEQQMMSLGVP